MNLPKLNRVPMRQEDEAGHEKEIWQPTWKCFCCHDSGSVMPHLARLVIEGYDQHTDKSPVCQNPGCNIHQAPEEYEKCFDYRLNAAICQHLDSIERQDWQETTKRRFINFKALAQKMNLRNGDRTSAEKLEAKQRHEGVSAR